jgi:hypothetical protein
MTCRATLSIGARRAVAQRNGMDVNGRGLPVAGEDTATPLPGWAVVRQRSGAYCDYGVVRSARRKRRALARDPGACPGSTSCLATVPGGSRG